MDKSAFVFFVFIGLLGMGYFYCAPNIVFASTTDGTVSGYAWSSEIGWINFGTFSGTDAVHITDSGLTGYAWNENKGRINLNPTKSGVKNNAEGALSGYAWCEGTGWINFSGVSVNSSGAFSGTATGDNNVSINFSCNKCNVQTDWRSASSRFATTATGLGGAGLPPEASVKPKLPLNFLINNGNQYTNNPNVTLKLQAGSDVKKMAISNSAGFENIAQEDYNVTKTWTLSSGDGAKNVYVKFYTGYGQPSETIQSSIILATVAPEIKITNIKQKYSPDEEVILGGTTEPLAQITLFIDANYAIFSADSQGNWLITLGKMPLGSHHIELFAKDLAGNTGKTISADFSVETGVPFTPVATLPPLLQKIKEGLTPLLPVILKPKELPPAKVITLPKIAPLALRGTARGLWNYLPVREINNFVLSPLPNDITLIAQKFPQVQKTFTEVGVAKITDVSKLQTANLKLPGLTQTLGMAQTEITPGKLTPPKDIPIAKLTSAAKVKIPSEIVFAKAAGGLVDYNIALSINDKGSTEQTIKTISGKPLQLVVRVNSPAKKVVGYIVFKSKTPSQAAFNVPLNYMSASLSFAVPDLSKIFEPAQIMLASLEGAPSLQANTVIKNTQIQKKLVLAEFEYQDTGDGVYTADVLAPVPAGEYEIMTIIDYQDPNLLPKEIDLITVVDPEGYVYEKNGNMETRITGAVASLYWLNPATKQYELWSAKDYQQENPQVTDVSGTYSFLVPDGYYYLKVDAPGYESYDGKPFQVTEGSGIHINIELKSQYWWLNVIDWKTTLLVIVILLLFYNFYRDKLREMISKSKSKAQQI